MATQALADETESATVETPLEQEATLEADMLTGFADEAVQPTSTETPSEREADSATPDEHEPATTTEATHAESDTAQADEPANELVSALQRIQTLEEKLKKSSDDMYGRLGFVEQVVKAQAKTPAGKQVRLKKEHFGQFAEEYPEFAEAQIQSINKVLEELEVTGLSQEFVAGIIKDSQAAAESAVEQRYIREQVKASRRDLDFTHKGWAEVVGLPEQDGGPAPDTEFRRWLTAQPKEYAEQVLGTYSPVVIGRAIDAFQESKKKPSVSPQTAKPSSSTRQQQLRAAVTPRASSAPPKSGKSLTTEEAMMMAFEGKT